MEKDFKKWHVLKSKINNNPDIAIFQEREIWWCSLGANVGVEQDGKDEFFERPVLIFHKFNKNMFLGLPISSKERSDKYHYVFSFRGKKSA